jgi:hypothetical protein
MNVEYACTDVQEHNSADHGHVNQHNLTYCTDIHCNNLTYFTDVKYVKLLQCICLRISGASFQTTFLQTSRRETHTGKDRERERQVGRQ